MNEILELEENDDNFFAEEQDELIDEHFDINKISEIVVYGTDWTTETILNQLTRGNIELNPRF